MIRGFSPVVPQRVERTKNQRMILEGEVRRLFELVTSWETSGLASLNTLVLSWAGDASILHGKMGSGHDSGQVFA